MPRAFNARRAERHLDKLWAEAIKRRDKCCQRCGKERNLQAAHIHSRSKKSTRHNLKNGVLLCAGCHKFWAHIHVVEFTEFCRRRMNPYDWDLLYLQASKPIPPLNPITYQFKAEALRP